MGMYTYAQRKKMPQTAFALPSKRQGGKGGYPITDEAHARNAEARVAQNGTPAEQAEVRSKVHARFPQIGRKGKGGKGKGKPPARPTASAAEEDVGE